VATLRPDQVRARIAATLEGLTLTTGTEGTLYEAPCGYHDMPAGLGDQRRHLAFGVAIVSTTESPEQRQRQTRPLRVEHVVSVRLVHKRRVTDAVADEDAALAAEAEAIVALLGTGGGDGLQVTYRGTSRREPIPEGIMITIDLRATHLIATA
jgi:hypothetical protein